MNCYLQEQVIIDLWDLPETNCFSLHTSHENDLMKMISCLVNHAGDESVNTGVKRTREASNGIHASGNMLFRMSTCFSDGRSMLRFENHRGPTTYCQQTPKVPFHLAAGVLWKVCWIYRTTIAAWSCKITICSTLARRCANHTQNEIHSLASSLRSKKAGP